MVVSSSCVVQQANGITWDGNAAPWFAQSGNYTILLPQLNVTGNINIHMSKGPFGAREVNISDLAILSGKKPEKPHKVVYTQRRYKVSTPYEAFITLTPQGKLQEARRWLPYSF